jgi:phospholipid N-methyltransferase
MMMYERAIFLKKFVENPREIGSVTPSSHYLTNRMLKRLSWKTFRAIVELGAGTGVFTQYILDHKTDSCAFVAIEKDELLYHYLKVHYPLVTMGKDALDLGEILNRQHIQQVDCVVSALPFAVMTPMERERIISLVSHCLTENGVFVLYQYSLQMRGTLKRYFRDVHIGLELRNLPPAFVYTCRQPRIITC